MLSGLKKFAHDKRGASFILMILGAVVIFIIMFAVIEVTKAYSVSFEVDTNLRRLLNNCVEFNIDDEFRQDGYNYLKTNEARQYFQDDFYTVTGTQDPRNGAAPFAIPGGGVITGNRFGNSNQSKEYLYTIHITKFEAFRGDTGGEPRAMIEGKLYIMNCLPAVLGDAHFSLPIRLQSTNGRIRSGITGEGVEGEIGEIINGALDGGAGEDLDDAIGGH